MYSHSACVYDIELISAPARWSPIGRCRGDYAPTVAAGDCIGEEVVVEVGEKGCRNTHTHSTTHDGTWFSSFSYPSTHPGHGPSLRAVSHERNDGWTSPYSITSCTYNTYTSQIQRDQAESRAGIVHARMPRIVQSSKNFSFSQSTPL